MILAADDVRDLHRRVVDDAGEVVGRQTVRAQQHEIADDLGIELHVAAHPVVEAHRGGGHLKRIVCGSPPLRRFTTSTGGKWRQVPS